MEQSLKVYLAGPEVFLPHAVQVGAQKKALCRQYGFEGLFPFDNEIETVPDARSDRLIYAANVEVIQAADFGIFNLTPFRGPSADVGTVFELGMMTALGKPAFGYTNNMTDILTRVVGARRDGSHGIWRDADGLMIEDYGNADNLMIDGALASGLNALVRWDGHGGLDEMGGFTACLALARNRMTGNATASSHRRVAARH